jgi:hypothetical protein
MAKFPALISFVVLFGLAACSPKIGNSCSTSVDCSLQGDRLCDTTQPSGYCTIFNCEPGSCPDGEAQCVAFNASLDPACAAASNATASPRFERTFCMKPCADDSDCRDGYACIDPHSRNAAIVDAMRTSDKVCMVAAYAAPANASASGPSGVCDPVDAGFDAPVYEGAGGSSGGAGGASAATGTGGMSAGGAGGA